MSWNCPNCGKAFETVLNERDHVGTCGGRLSARLPLEPSALVPDVPPADESENGADEPENGEANDAK